MVVYQGDEGYALNPQPCLSAGLGWIIGGDFESMCADEDVCLQRKEDRDRDGVGVLEVDTSGVDDLVN